MADLSEVSWDEAAYSRPGWTTARAFAEYMAREIGVAVVPGSSFYAGAGQGITRVRLNYAKREETLRQAGQRLQKLRAG
jgi:aminotransferase